MDGRGGDDPPGGPPAIELAGLTKRYRRGKGWFTAVNDVTLSVPPGQVIGLLGPNGAGKTTTIKMACGLIVPTAGTIRINGYDVGSRGDRGMVAFAGNFGWLRVGGWRGLSGWLGWLIGVRLLLWGGRMGRAARDAGPSVG